MKKTFYFIFLLHFSFFLFAQNAEKQVMIPHTVFIGDTAQLNISFSSKKDFFKDLPQGHNNSNQELSFQNFQRPLDEKTYSIKKIVLTQNNSSNQNQINYTFSIYFTPWITGEIKFPPYALEKDFVISPSAIHIESILDATKKSQTFSENKGPLFIPGTTYRILFKIIGFLIFIGIIISAFCKWNRLVLFWKNLKLKILYARNKKETINSLNLLKRAKISDKEKAEQIQSILRNYLTIRFSFPFKNCGASEIWKGFDAVFLGLLSETKEDAVDDLTGIFTRTDFIRYSKDAVFGSDELKSIIIKLISIINIFETNEKSNEKEDQK